MKTIIAIRSRIIEITTGLILIALSLRAEYKTIQYCAPDLNFHWLNVLTSKTLLAYCFGELFYILIGIMLVFRAYRKLPLKIAYCITGATAFAFSSEALILYNYFTSYIIGRMPTSLMIQNVSANMLLGAAIVIGFMTINRNITWRSRKHLLIYTYLLMALIVVMGIHDWTSAVIILLPTFMQEHTEKTDIRGIIGGIAIIASILVPELITYQYEAFLLLAPLMVFERECSRCKAEEKMAVENDVTLTL